MLAVMLAVMLAIMLLILIEQSLIFFQPIANVIMLLTPIFIRVHHLLFIMFSLAMVATASILICLFSHFTLFHYPHFIIILFHCFILLVNFQRLVFLTLYSSFTLITAFSVPLLPLSWQYPIVIALFSLSFLVFEASGWYYRLRSLANAHWSQIHLLTFI